MDALNVENLTVTYEGGYSPFKNLTLSIADGQATVICGSSGCGKSTLCSTVCGLIPGVKKAKINGTVKIYGKLISDMSPSDIASKVGMVFQNPDDQLICTTVEDELAFGLENLCVPRDEIRKRIDCQMRYFSIDHLALKNPSKLSGGQKKLVTIASVLVLEPDIIILDEPMTGLDENSRMLVDSAVRKLRDDGRTLIVVEHWLDNTDYADEIINIETLAGRSDGQ